jgi:hypothetical protein
MKIVEQTKQNFLQYLPIEIINTILEYQGYHTWINGKFICRLNINDKKYDNLKKLNIIKKIKDGSHKVTITIMRNNYVHNHLYKCTIEQKISRTKIHWYMYRYWYYSIHPNKKRYSKPCVDSTYYVFDKDISQNLPMLPMDYTYKK